MTNVNEIYFSSSTFLFLSLIQMTATVLVKGGR